MAISNKKKRNIFLSGLVLLLSIAAGSLISLFIISNIPNMAVPSNTPWIWYISRSSGITSYLMLFLLIIVGIGISSGYIFKLFGPIIAWRMHRTIGITLVAFIAIHLISLAYDPFMKFSPADLFVPFHSTYNPLYLSLGIIGFYLFILIILTSIFIIISKYKIWKFVHYLTYPTFIALFIHGAFIGTDSKTLIMQLIYWITGIIVGIAFAYRLIKIPSRKSRKKILNGMRL